MDKIELASRLEALARGEGAVKVADILDAAVALRESEEWRTDAERFAWLRDRSLGQWDNPIVVMLYVGPLIGKELDAAIDAARKEGV